MGKSNQINPFFEEGSSPKEFSFFQEDKRPPEERVLEVLKDFLASKVFSANLWLHIFCEYDMEFIDKALQLVNLSDQLMIFECAVLAAKSKNLNYLADKLQVKIEELDGYLLQMSQEYGSDKQNILWLLQQKIALSLAEKSKFALENNYPEAIDDLIVQMSSIEDLRELDKLLLQHQLNNIKHWEFLTQNEQWKQCFFKLGIKIAEYKHEQPIGRVPVRCTVEVPKKEEGFKQYKTSESICDRGGVTIKQDTAPVTGPAGHTILNTHPQNDISAVIQAAGKVSPVAILSGSNQSQEGGGTKETAEETKLVIDGIVASEHTHEVSDQEGGNNNCENAPSPNDSDSSKIILSLLETNSSKNAEVVLAKDAESLPIIPPKNIEEALTPKEAELFKLLKQHIQAGKSIKQVWKEALQEDNPKLIERFFKECESYKATKNILPKLDLLLNAVKFSSKDIVYFLYSKITFTLKEFSAAVNEALEKNRLDVIDFFIRQADTDPKKLKLLDKKFKAFKAEFEEWGTREQKRWDKRFAKVTQMISPQEVLVEQKTHVEQKEVKDHTNDLELHQDSPQPYFPQKASAALFISTRSAPNLKLEKLKENFASIQKEKLDNDAVLVPLKQRVKQLQCSQQYLQRQEKLTQEDYCLTKWEIVRISLHPYNFIGHFVLWIFGVSATARCKEKVSNAERVNSAMQNLRSRPDFENPEPQDKERIEKELIEKSKSLELGEKKNMELTHALNTCETELKACEADIRAYEDKKESEELIPPSSPPLRLQRRERMLMYGL